MSVDTTSGTEASASRDGIGTGIEQLDTPKRVIYKVVLTGGELVATNICITANFINFYLKQEGARTVFDGWGPGGMNVGGPRFLL